MAQTESDTFADPLVPRLMAACRLGWKLALLTLAVILTGTTLLFAIPDGNDMGLAYLDKHAWLSKAGSPKIVLVGGSNLLYGIDSEIIEKELGRPTVNMGLNGYLGPRFMLSDIKDDLHPGDLVVISFEYEAYFEPTPYYSTEGMALQQLMLIKLRPASVRYLDTWGQHRRVLKALFEAVQDKVIRIADEWLHARWNRHPVSEEERYLRRFIENRSGVNARGDLVSHLGVTYPFPYRPPLDLDGLVMSEPLLRLLRSFNEEMKARGVQVVMTPPPVPRNWYERNRAMIDQSFARVEQMHAEGMPPLLGKVAELVYPQSLFFNNMNHVNGEGRSLRTRQLISYLKSYLMAGTARPAVTPTPAATTTAVAPAP